MMYCPKCKQTFEEGSRRFCPTDGTRLISEAVEQSGTRNEGGIFRHLLPKMEGDRSRDERLTAKPPPQAPEPAPDIPGLRDVFFEFDDVDLELDDFSVVDQKVIDHAAPPAEPTPQIQQPTQPTTQQPQIPSQRPPQRDVRSVPPPIPEPETRRVTKKISLADVPAGHVDLDREEGSAAFNPDFDDRDPGAFVGRIVKGRYKVIDLLGSGGDGFAYLGEDKLMDDRKVLVRILSGPELGETMSATLAEERVSLSHLTHPNIARLIDSGEFTNGIPFLITEYVDALSVRDVLEVNGRLDPSRGARIIRQASYALSDAHQQGVVHRDIRPENIILDPAEDGTEIAKLVSFGASDGAPNEHNMAYKAPEVLDGRAPSAASDLFSLAVAAYEMLTGRVPFTGESMRDLMKEHHAGLQLPASGASPQLPRQVDDVFARAFSFTPANRYQKAREFGDALAAALTTPVREPKPAHAPVTVPLRPAAPPMRPIITPDPTPTDLPAGLKKPMRPVVDNVKLEPLEPLDDEPAWMRRSPEPPQTGSSKLKWLAAIGIPILLVLLVAGWFWVFRNPIDTVVVPTTNVNGNTNAQADRTPEANIDLPPPQRTIPQPANSVFFQNNKQNLKGDLVLNFVGFSLYYPKDWKVNGPEPGTKPNSRGKFLDIARQTPDGRMKEQMLISYYPSKGTFTDDAGAFPQLVKETNDTLKGILPEYQMISEGETVVNGGWKAYEVRFQGGGTAANGEKLTIWGRRLFIPAARPGVRDGFEVTLLATSLAEDIKGVEDLGKRGELGTVFQTFEPSQSF